MPIQRITVNIALFDKMPKPYDVLQSNNLFVDSISTKYIDVNHYVKSSLYKKLGLNQIKRKNLPLTISIGTWVQIMSNLYLPFRSLLGSDLAPLFTKMFNYNTSRVLLDLAVLAVLSKQKEVEKLDIAKQSAPAL